MLLFREHVQRVAPHTWQLHNPIGKSSLLLLSRCVPACCGCASLVRETRRQTTPLCWNQMFSTSATLSCSETASVESLVSIWSLDAETMSLVSSVAVPGISLLLPSNVCIYVWGEWSTKKVREPSYLLLQTQHSSFPSRSTFHHLPELFQLKPSNILDLLDTVFFFLFVVVFFNPLSWMAVKLLGNSSHLRV